MKHFGRKIRWKAKSSLGLGLVLIVVLAATQITDFVNVWISGPNTGYRLAGLTSGHYERQIAGVLQRAPTIGHVFVGRGERLVVDYDLTVNEGKVSFAVWKWPITAHRPNHISAQKIESSGRGRVDFVAKRTGYYRLYIYANRWQGAISVDWRTESAEQQSAGLAEN